LWWVAPFRVIFVQKRSHYVASAIVNLHQWVDDLEVALKSVARNAIRLCDIPRSFVAAVALATSLVVAGLLASAVHASPHGSKKGVSWDPVVTRAGFVSSADVGSLANTASIVGADSYWRAGFDGTGIGVALIDTGVSPVGPLAGIVVNGPDLSFDSQAPNLRYLDGNGHGTFTAGIIDGMAPGARILNVKAGNFGGQVDVSQVIAAIDWVVQHRNDNGMNIRVLNLSYGTDSTQSYRVDPLAFAVEQAWKAGIVVVTAAGNAGFVPGGSLTDPAIDPFVIAVGAADTNGTLPTYDDTVAAFSSNGDIWRLRPVDVLAPGTHIVSLRDPGSYIDDTDSGTGAVSDTLFRGSGTSEAAAVVSGGIALMLQEHPSFTPDQVKRLIWTSETRLKGVTLLTGGAGELNLAPTFKKHMGSARQPWMPSSGTGLLEGSRGDIHVSLDGIPLTGEQDIFGAPFNSAALAALEATQTSWSGGVWNGNVWTGNSWSAGAWPTAAWSGNSWSGNSWSGNSWSGNSWSGNSWSSAFWG
jgi:serine protease AprX